MTDARLVVLTSCTSRKRPLGPGEKIPAEDLYLGEQHRRLMQGVHAARAAGMTIDLRIVSAAHGLLRSDTRLGDYDETFSGLSTTELDRAAGALAIATGVAEALTRPYDLGLILLGSDYLRAARFFEVEAFGGPTCVLCGRAEALRLPAARDLHPMLAGKAEARRYSCGLVGLKGEMARRILTRVALDPTVLKRIAASGGEALEQVLGSTEVASQLELVA